MLHEQTWNKFMGEEFAHFNLQPGLANITCTVLYLVGEFDCVHPPACAEKTRALMTNANVEFHLIKDSADPVYVEQWDQSINLVANFVNKL